MFLQKAWLLGLGTPGLKKALGQQKKQRDPDGASASENEGRHIKSRGTYKMEHNLKQPNSVIKDQNFDKFKSDPSQNWHAFTLTKFNYMYANVEPDLG